jgi:hypothetical protein
MVDKKALAKAPARTSVPVADKDAKREKLSSINVKRTTIVKQAPKDEPSPPPVSAGPLDRVLDFTYNASREKSREVTIISPTQGRILPVLDVINTAWEYILEVAQYRQDKEAYQILYNRDRPILPNLIEDFMYRTSQWQKSVSGTNLKSLNDLALAEMETKTEGDEGAGYDDIYGRD